MTSSVLLSCLISKLSSLKPVKGVRWVFEILDHTSYGPEVKRASVEEIEQLCTQLLQDMIIEHWSYDLTSEIQVGLGQAQFEPRGKPLADIAWLIRDEHPEKATEISRILLDEHERRMKETLVADLHFPYMPGRWNHEDWIIALAAAVIIYHKDVDPMEWAIAKCKTLPLSVWDADDHYEIFRAAEQVAQIQIKIALYAVQFLNEANRVLYPDKLLIFVEKVWEHTDFARKYNGISRENIEIGELAGRVAVALVKPTDAWLLRQAQNPAVDPRALCGMLEQIDSDNLDIGADVIAKIRNIASYRYVNIKCINLQSLLHFANLWKLLDAPMEAEASAQLALTFYQSDMDRNHKIATLKMLAFAKIKGKLSQEFDKTSLILYNDLWESYTPPHESASRQEIDTLLKNGQAEIQLPS